MRNLDKEKDLRFVLSTAQCMPYTYTYAMPFKLRIRAGKHRFFSELLVYLENCPPRLISLFLKMIWNPKIYDLEWKKNYKTFWILSYDFRFCLGTFTTHLTYQCPKCRFNMEKNSIPELALYNAFFCVKNTCKWYVKCVVTLPRPNLKSWNIIKNII